MDTRIAPPREYEEFLDDLTETDAAKRRDHPEVFRLAAPIFETKQKALMFAAALGKFLKRPAPSGGGKRGEAIRMTIFEKASDDAYLSALAVAENGALEMLAPAKEADRVALFESYLVEGLAELKRTCLASGDPLLNLVKLTLDARVAVPAEVEGVDAKILHDLLA